jgi:muramidase (phage lysozyme)
MTTKALLDFIAEHESRGDYNTVWGGIAARHRPKRPLTTMTIAEVLAWQDSIDPLYRSEAAGKYQIMEDTLRGLYVEAGLGAKALFDEDNQDRLAEALLRRRGLGLYRSGAMTAEAFANSLAKEWASLPVVTGKKKGQSYYSGDGLNKALVNVEPFLAAVRAARDGAPAPVDHVAPAPVPRNWLAKLIAAIVAWFGGRK